MTDGLDTFADDQRLTLQKLRARYAQDHDHFTHEELARLTFLRWLRDTGIIETDVARRSGGDHSVTLETAATGERGGDVDARLAEG